MNESCKTCAFFEPEAHDNQTEGTCRRYAPRPGDSVEERKNFQLLPVEWPIVMGSNWCGEWKRVGG